MIKRKLQFNEGSQSYFLVVPKQIAEALNYQKGDIIGFRILGDKITLERQG